MGSKLKIGVVGVGFFGRLHALSFQGIPRAELAGVFDINEKRAGAVSQELGIPAFKRLEDLLKTSQALTVCVPTSSHYEVAKEIIQSKKHCLVEKPFTKDLRQAWELLELARKKRVFLQAGHIERFNSAFQSVKKKIKNPLFIEIHRLNLFSQRSLDISVVLDLMIHDIDIVLGLVGSPIKRIEATGIEILSPYPDIAQARLVFENGCIANITSSRVSDETLRKLRVFTSRMYASIDYKSQQGYIFQKTDNAIKKTVLNIEKELSLKRELQDFALCCQGRKKPLFSLEEALRSLGVAFKIENKIKFYGKNIRRLR